MKKGKKQNGLKAFLKRNRVGVIIWGSIAAFLLIPFILVSYYTWEGAYTNPAKKLASIMIPFARENNLRKIDDYNGFVGGLPLANDNTTPFFIYIYRGDQPLNTLHELTKNYLEKNGYTIESVSVMNSAACSGYPDKPVSQECDPTIIQGFTINKGESFWMFKGKNISGDEVSGEISNRTYYNHANSMGYKSGEHSIPKGKTVLNITFTSHEQ